VGLLVVGSDGSSGSNEAGVGALLGDDVGCFEGEPVGCNENLQTTH
jgi:hypothetical protein